MAILDINSLSAQAAPIAKATIGLVWSIIQLLLLLGALLYIYFYTSFNVRVLERKYTKGGRVIATIKRAKKVFDKKLNHPQLQFFGIMGFKGKQLNEPPADCIIPFQTGLFGNTVMYDFIVKDGVHYPVANAVLGKKYIVDTEDKDLQKDDAFMQWAGENSLIVQAVGNPHTVVYSIEGSGLEVSRDFDAEQASLNNLINAADKYKNRKPIEIAAMYGLMIICLVGVTIMVVYALYKVGSISDAVNRGWEIFDKLGSQVVSSKLGPG